MRNTPASYCVEDPGHDEGESDRISEYGFELGRIPGLGSGGGLCPWKVVQQGGLLLLRYEV